MRAVIDIDITSVYGAFPSPLPPVCRILAPAACYLVLDRISSCWFLH